MISRVLFMGSKQFGLDTLQLLHKLSPVQLIAVVTIDDRNDSRSRYGSFVEFCNNNDINLKLSGSKAVTCRHVQECKPDLVFVNGWYQIIDKATLSIPGHGFIGIHHSPLPKYRGGSPLVWQIMNNEKKLGSSLFCLDQGTDSGDIIASVSVENDNLYIADARDKLESKMLECLTGVWPKIICGAIKPTPQPTDGATYCSQLLPEDGLLNWNRSALDVLSQIRAQSHPYPCAFSTHKGAEVRIVSAQLYDTIIYGLPGQLVAFDKSARPVIACSSGESIVIEKVMLGDGSIVSAREVLASMRIRLGS